MPYDLSNYQQPQEQEETWDLRQFYVRYVGVYMLEYQRAESQKNYPEMLSILDKWHAIVHGRVAKHLGEDGKVHPDKLYNNLKEELILAANKYESTYRGKDRNKVGVDEIESKFKEIIVYMFYKMTRHELFGKKRDISGL